MVSTAAFHARVRGLVPGGLKETRNVSSPSTCKSQYCGEPPWPRGSLLGLRPPGCEFLILCLRTVSSHHPQEVLLAQFSLYVHKGGLKLDSFHLQCVYGFMYVWQHEYLANCDLMLGQRRRRWTNIKPTLGKLIVFAGMFTHLLFTDYVFHMLRVCSLHHNVRNWSWPNNKCDTII